MGPVQQVLDQVVAETGAAAVYWSRRYEPALRARDEELKSWLESEGVAVRVFNSALLVEPEDVTTKQGKPFRVFTPFWKACLKGEITAEPTRRTRSDSRVPPQWPESLELAALELEPTIDWAGGIRAAWTPGEAGAAARLDTFLGDALESYADGRDRPDWAGTSRLSPHLHFGEIGPRQVWHAVQGAGAPPGAEEFLRQVFWREFAYHLLFHEPHTTDHPLREEFAAFPWATDDEQLAAWQRGRTGFPYIDAGMRQLWETGWMHNRVRMAAASFLVKDLLIPWQEGGEMVLGHPSSTPTSPTTRSGGSGPPGAGPTRRPTSESSTPSSKESASTPTAATSADGSRNYGTCPTRSSTVPGTPPAQCPTIPVPWSTIAKPGRARSRPTKPCGNVVRVAQGPRQAARTGRAGRCARFLLCVRTCRSPLRSSLARMYASPGRSTCLRIVCGYRPIIVPAP